MTTSRLIGADIVHNRRLPVFQTLSPAHTRNPFIFHKNDIVLKHDERETDNPVGCFGFISVPHDDFLSLSQTRGSR